MDGYPPSPGVSPTNPKMLTHQEEVYCILGIWHSQITHKNNTR